MILLVENDRIMYLRFEDKLQEKNRSNFLLIALLQRFQMMNSTRDDFPQSLVRKVAERVAYICSNPACKNVTIGPHTNPEKSLSTGKGCHIFAAAPGGPRYDASQTTEQRKGANNCIWLCSVCSDKIDKDPAEHPAELLLTWKENHESWVKNGGVVPALPQITVRTLTGRTLSEVPCKITENDMEEKEHYITIQNASETELVAIDALVQVPEPITATRTSQPIGTNIKFEPKRPEMVAFVTGGASITRTGPPLPTTVYRLQIDKLSARQSIEVGILTSRKIINENDMSFDKGVWEGIDGPNCARNYLDGTFQFAYRGSFPTRRFFAPLNYNSNDRSISVIEVLGDTGNWQKVEMMIFT